MPSSIAAIIAAAPDVPAFTDIGDSGIVPQAVAESEAPATCVDTRLIFSVDGLPASRTVSVRHGARRDGTVLVTAEHTLGDVAQLICDKFRLSSSAQLYRATLGEDLRVPLHQQQYRRLAMPFLANDNDCLVVD